MASLYHSSETTGEASPWFVEIRRPPPKDERPRTLAAFAIPVAPKECSQWVKRLGVEYPLTSNLSHLKRVRKKVIMSTETTQEPSPEQNEEVTRTKNNDPIQQDKKKTKKNSNSDVMLQILIGTERSDEMQAKWGRPFQNVVVPGRPPQNEAEAKEFTAQLWPVHFFPLKDCPEELAKQRLLESSEQIFMKKIMEQETIPQRVVVLVNPLTKTVVSRSIEEQEKQNVSSSSSSQRDTSMLHNPLATPILLAIQGVSRREREAALQQSADEFSQGQYLCTGYDLYAYYEPTIFEAMACLHSRLRRLIFVKNPKENIIWGHGCTRHFVHSLPGTNHQYRVFEYKNNLSEDNPNN